MNARLEAKNPESRFRARAIRSLTNAALAMTTRRVSGDSFNATVLGTAPASSSASPAASAFAGGSRSA